MVFGSLASLHPKLPVALLTVGLSGVIFIEPACAQLDPTAVGDLPEGDRSHSVACVDSDGDGDLDQAAEAAVPCFRNTSQLAEPVASGTGAVPRQFVAPVTRSDVYISWASDPRALTYSLYRGNTKGLWPLALVTGIADTMETLDDLAFPPRLYFYRTTGSSCSGEEGP